MYRNEGVCCFRIRVAGPPDQNLTDSAYRKTIGLAVVGTQPSRRRLRGPAIVIHAITLPCEAATARSQVVAEGDVMKRQTGTRRRAGYEQINADYGSNEIRYESRADVLSAGWIDYKLVGAQVGGFPTK